jgi:hypothetical protein
MTESGVGSFACLDLRWAGAALISDSADELRSRDTGFESRDVVDGRRGEFALMSCSSSEACPSRPAIDGSSSSRIEWLVLLFVWVSDSVVNKGVASAEGTRSRARGREGPRGLVNFLAVWTFFC